MFASVIPETSAIKERIHRDIHTLVSFRRSIVQSFLEAPILEKIERLNSQTGFHSSIKFGGMSCAVGLVFEIAALVGVKLFEPDSIPLSKHIEYTQDTIALLPKRIKAKRRAVRDGF